MNILWSMRLFDNDEEIVHKAQHQASELMLAIPEELARDLAEAYFTLEKWNLHFGGKTGEGEVIVEFHEPLDLEGLYRVELELQVRAESIDKMEIAKP